MPANGCSPVWPDCWKGRRHPSSSSVLYSVLPLRYRRGSCQWTFAGSCSPSIDAGEFVADSRDRRTPARQAMRWSRQWQLARISFFIPNPRRASACRSCLCGKYAVYRGACKRAGPVSSVGIALQHGGSSRGWAPTEPAMGSRATPGDGQLIDAAQY